MLDSVNCVISHQLVDVWIAVRSCRRRAKGGGGGGGGRHVVFTFLFQVGVDCAANEQSTPSQGVAGALVAFPSLYNQKQNKKNKNIHVKSVGLIALLIIYLRLRRGWWTLYFDIVALSSVVGSRVL